MVRSVLCLLTVALAFVPLLSAVEGGPKNKRGLCPSPGDYGICAHVCYADDDCQGANKCCPTNCGTICEPPVIKTKPGSCPDPNLHFKTCKTECTDDGQCEKNLKCCNSNCGLQCVPPEHGNRQTR
uniref:WAP domain-containing protein n=1 Tax=Periophthalmus magnuspinnatus TaxID=409849 RepID=A0A3B3ZGS3_9GOBI